MAPVLHTHIHDAGRCLVRDLWGLPGQSELEIGVSLQGQTEGQSFAYAGQSDFAKNRVALEDGAITFEEVG